MCPAIVGPDYYLSAGIFSSSEDTGTAKRRMVSDYLRAAGEPSLTCGGGNDLEAYRVIVIDAFSGDPTIIRVTHANNVTEVSGTVLHGFQTAEKIKRSLNDETWATIRNAIESINFWFTPLNEIGMTRRFTADADEIVLEGRRQRAYHAVVRVLGSKSDTLARMYFVLTAAAGFRNTLQ